MDAGWTNDIEVKLLHASGIGDISIGLGNHDQFSFLFTLFPALDSISLALVALFREWALSLLFSPSHIRDIECLAEMPCQFELEIF